MAKEARGCAASTWLHQRHPTKWSYEPAKLPPPVQSANLREMYRGTRHDGLGQEVKRRILMGTYALSAGFVDAYYKRAQQARPGALAGPNDAVMVF